MITVQFPALQKALTKDVKDLPEDDPRRGIIILNNTAIVLRNSFCLVCNLYDYFTIEAGIEDDLELAELEKILFFLDGKIINSEFWAELTKGANMKMNNGNLFVENPKYSKDLHYKEFDADFLEPLIALEKLAESPTGNIDCIALPFGMLNIIYTCLASEFKKDMIIFEFIRQDAPVRFTFKNRKHFYGYIHPNYDAAQGGFMFDELNSFTNSVKGYLETLKEKAKVPTPPTENEE